MPSEISGIDLITSESRLSEVVDGISRMARVAVDIESNGFFRYHERICLVQLATTQAVYLVDPLAIADVRPLGDLFGNRSVEKVFHAPDYDIRSLDRDWGFRVNNLFDTGAAAALVGFPQLGLQSVVKECVGVEWNKLLRLQRSDWSVRPLSSEALRYAADDVLHLLEVRDVLSARLTKLSRLEWAMEEFVRLENVRHTAPDRAMAFLSIKGSRGLDGRGLAVLHSLCQFREREARLADRPPFKVIPNSALIELSSQPAADLSLIKGLGKFGRPPADRRLKAAIDEGLRSQPLIRQQREAKREKLDPEELNRIGSRMRRLKTWRSQLADGLQLSPGLIWPTDSLMRLARHPSDPDSEFVHPEVRNWQKREFGAALLEVLSSLD